MNTVCCQELILDRWQRDKHGREVRAENIVEAHCVTIPHIPGNTSQTQPKPCPPAVMWRTTLSQKVRGQLAMNTAVVNTHGACSRLWTGAAGLAALTDIKEETVARKSCVELCIEALYKAVDRRLRVVTGEGRVPALVVGEAVGPRCREGESARMKESEGDRGGRGRADS